MSKIPLPLFVGDISAFAKSLRTGLEAREGLPGHVEMLNLLAKAGGYRNFQHYKAQQEARQSLDAPRPEPPEVNYKLVRRVAGFHDAEGRLVRWPGKFSQRMVCLWALWSRIPARTAFSEREMNELVEKWHLFGDHALLRRELVDRGMVSRTPDGSRYERIERRPPAEAVILIQRLHS